MADKIDNGGAAFPRSPCKDPLINGQPGMTLRDYFAIRFAVKMYTPGEDDCVKHELCLDAYEFADAMLEARKQ